MSKDWKFNLNQPVKIKASGEAGTVLSRAEHVGSADDYRIHYVAADGRAVTDWFADMLLEPSAPLAPRF